MFSVSRLSLTVLCRVIVVCTTIASTGPSADREAIRATFDANGPFDHTGLVKNSSPDSQQVAQSSGPAPQLGGAANDECDAAAVIPGNTVTYNPPLLNTLGAVAEICEAQENCETGNVGTSNSVWYVYSPDQDGAIRVDTAGSNYDTVLSVFDRCGAGKPGSCNTPIQFVCNDNIGLGSISQVELAVEVGRTYFIKVADQNTLTGGGSLDFNLVFIPPNDRCPDARTISGVAFDPPLLPITHATEEACEADDSCELNGFGASNTVWYRYTPSCDGSISVNTNGSSYDTVLSVWDGCGMSFGPDYPCLVANEIACDDDSGMGLNSQLVDVPVSEGVDYLIKVGQFDAAPGSGTLDFNFLFDGALPPLAEITSPLPDDCLCDSVAVRGSISASDGSAVPWILDFQPVAGGAWMVLAADTGVKSDEMLLLWDTSGLAPGDYLLRLSARDACGVSTTDVAVNAIRPQFDTVEVRSPEAGAVVGGAVCIDGTVAGSVCFDEYTVSFRPAGSGDFAPVDPGHPVYDSAVVNDPLAPNGWNTTALPDGDYELLVKAFDLCDGVQEALRTITIDNTPPIALISQPSACAFFDDAVEIRGTAEDDHDPHWILQYTGGDDPNWTTIVQGQGSVIDGLLGIWDVSILPPCAYTLRLLVSDAAIVDCAGPNTSEFLMSVQTMPTIDACPIDFDGDGDQDLDDYAEFQNCHTGPLP